jgi:hypothetical protein
MDSREPAQPQTLMVVADKIDGTVYELFSSLAIVKKLGMGD